MLVASVYSFGRLQLGLEQQLVLPTGSYLLPYFDQQATLGEAGPPVYIVLQNVNYTNVAQAAPAIGHLTDMISSSNLIVRPITNWYDQFLNFTSDFTSYTQQCYVQTQKQCLDCPLPLSYTSNASFTFEQQACFFLYAIPLQSKCCQVR
jgi:hypothetical protein